MASPRNPQGLEVSNLATSLAAQHFLNPDHGFKDMVFLSGNIYFIQTSTLQEDQSNLQILATLQPTLGILPVVPSSVYKILLSQLIGESSSNVSLVEENGFFKNIIILNNKLYLIINAQLRIGGQQQLLAHLQLIGALPKIPPPHNNHGNNGGAAAEEKQASPNAAGGSAGFPTTMLIFGGQAYPLMSGQLNFVDGQRQFTAQLGQPSGVLQTLTTAPYRSLVTNVEMHNATLPAATSSAPASVGMQNDIPMAAASSGPAGAALGESSKKARKYNEGGAQASDEHSDTVEKEPRASKKSKGEEKFEDDTNEDMEPPLKEIHYIEFASAIHLYRKQNPIRDNNKVEDFAPFFIGYRKQSNKKNLGWKHKKRVLKTTPETIWAESNNQYKVWVYWNVSGVRELILLTAEIKPEYIDIAVNKENDEENAPPVYKIRIQNNGIQEIISKRWHRVGEQSLRFLFETVLLPNIPYQNPLPKNNPITKEVLEKIGNESKNESLNYRLHQAFVARARAHFDGEFVSAFLWQCETVNIELELHFSIKTSGFNVDKSGGSYNFSELNWYNLPELGGSEYQPYDVRPGQAFYKITVEPAAQEEKQERVGKFKSKKPLLKYTFFQDAYYGELYGIDPDPVTHPNVTGTVLYDIFTYLYKIVKPERKTLICDDSCIQNAERTIRLPLRLMKGLNKKSTWYMKFGATLFGCHDLKTLFEGKLTQSMPQWLAALERILATQLVDWLKSFRTNQQQKLFAKLISRVYQANDESKYLEAIRTNTIDTLFKKIYQIDGERHLPVPDSNMTIFLELLMNGSEDLTRVSINDWLTKLTLLKADNETIQNLAKIAQRYSDPKTETLDTLSCMTLLNRTISLKNEGDLPQFLQNKNITQAEKNADNKFLASLVESHYCPTLSLNSKYNKAQPALLYNALLMDVHTVLWSGRVWQLLGIENLPQENAASAMKLG